MLQFYCRAVAVPLPLRELIARATGFPSALVALEYLEPELKRVCNRLAQKVPRYEMNWARIERGLLDFLMANQIRDPFRAYHALQLLPRDASGDQMVDALTEEFESAHAHISMHEQADWLRELTVKAAIARDAWYSATQTYRYAKELRDVCKIERRRLQAEGL